MREGGEGSQRRAVWRRGRDARRGEGGREAWACRAGRIVAGMARVACRLLSGPTGRSPTLPSSTELFQLAALLLLAISPAFTWLPVVVSSCATATAHPSLLSFPRPRRPSQLNFPLQLQLLPFQVYSGRKIRKSPPVQSLPLAVHAVTSNHLSG